MESLLSFEKEDLTVRAEIRFTSQSIIVKITRNSGFQSSSVESTVTLEEARELVVKALGDSAFFTISTLSYASDAEVLHYSDMFYRPSSVTHHKSFGEDGAIRVIVDEYSFYEPENGKPHRTLAPSSLIAEKEFEKLIQAERFVLLALDKDEIEDIYQIDCKPFVFLI